MLKKIGSALLSILLLLSASNISVLANGETSAETAEETVYLVDQYNEVDEQGNKIPLKSKTLQVGDDITLLLSSQPELQNGESLEWKSDNESIAKVVRDIDQATVAELNTYTVSAISEGTTKISVKKIIGESKEELTSIDIIVEKAQEAKIEEAVIPEPTQAKQSSFVDEDVEQTETIETSEAPETPETPTLQLSEETISIAKGESAALTAVIGGESAEVTWSSVDDTIATVDESGKVTGVSAGQTVITAILTSDSSVTATCKVTVNEPAESVVNAVILDPTSLSLKIGDTAMLDAAIDPSTVTDQTVTWSSSDSSIVSVDSNGNVKAVAAGNAYITVISNADETKTAVCAVTVSPVDVTSVTLNKTSFTMKVTETASLSATVQPSNATDKTIKWSSSDGSVVTVDQNGKLKAEAVGTAKITAASSNGKSTTATITVKNLDNKITYSAHVQNIGWQAAVSNGNIAGTTGKKLRLEAIKISLPSDLKSLGGIATSVHVENIGWMSEVGDGQVAGTTGRKLRLEAITIRLTGNLADKYNIYYRVHVQNYGWLGWASNGSPAGSTHQSLRIEAIQIDIRPKTDGNVYSVGNYYKGPNSFTYQAHVANVGWMGNVGSGKTAGNEKQRIEALKFTLPVEMDKLGGISAQAHVQNIGWMSAVDGYTTCGTTGRSLRLEGIKLSLTGNLGKQYDIYYRVNVWGIGWLGWTKNGALAGSTGCNRAIIGIQVEIVTKGASHATGTAYTTNKYVAPKPKVTQYTPTYYSQVDGRWSGVTIGRYRFASSGCLPSSVAMAVNGILNNGVRPIDVGWYLYNNTSEFNKLDVGGSGLAIKYGANHWGLKTTGISSAAVLKSELSKGRIVCIAMNPGIFAGRGWTHCIVLFKNSGGRTYVYDPLYSSKNGWYSIDTIWNQRSTNWYDLRGGYVGYSVYR